MEKYFFHGSTGGSKDKTSLFSQATHKQSMQQVF